MGRSAFLLLLVLAACPKKKAEEAEPASVGSGSGSAGPPPSGRSVTKVKDGEEEGSGEGRLTKAASGGSEGGSDSAAAGSSSGTGSAAGGGSAGSSDGEPKKFGGNGAPPYYDDEGHLHGPGGPVFMGKGPECNAERDHCMRPGVWFSVGNLVAGKLYRAVPVYEFEKKWYNWRGREESFAMRFKTKVATKETIKVGEPIIWFIDENSSKKFVDNEYDALTSSRWEAGYVEGWAGSDKVRVAGWTYGVVPVDTIRVIVERGPGNQ